MLRALLFDFNGVFVDDEHLHFETLRRVLADEGLELTSDDYYLDYIGYDDSGCIRAAYERARCDLAPDRLMGLVARKASYYQERIGLEGYRFFPGAVELAKAAADADLTLAIVSGALRQEIEQALRQADVRALFKIVVSAEDVRESKPDPAGYRLAVQGLNSQSPLPARLFHPHEIVAIEDTLPGLEAATGAGLVTLGVGHTLPLERLEPAANVTIAGLEDLSMDALQQLFRDVSAS